MLWVGSRQHPLDRHRFRPPRPGHAHSGASGESPCRQYPASSPVISGPADRRRQRSAVATNEHLSPRVRPKYQEGPSIQLTQRHILPDFFAKSEGKIVELAAKSAAHVPSDGKQTFPVQVDAT